MLPVLTTRSEAIERHSATADRTRSGGVLRSAGKLFPLPETSACLPPLPSATAVHKLLTTGAPPGPQADAGIGMAKLYSHGPGPPCSGTLEYVSCWCSDEHLFMQGTFSALCLRLSGNSSPPSTYIHMSKSISPHHSCTRLVCSRSTAKHLTSVEVYG